MTDTLLILAETGGQATGNPIAGLLPFILIGLVFYLLIIRPQRKRQQDQQQLLRSLNVGDEVITIGGFHGEIIQLGEETVDLEIARDVVVTIARSAVSKTINPDEEPPVLDDVDFDDIDLDAPDGDDTR